MLRIENTTLELSEHFKPIQATKLDEGTIFDLADAEVDMDESEFLQFQLDLLRVDCFYRLTKGAGAIAFMIGEIDAGDDCASPLQHYTEDELRTGKPRGAAGASKRKKSRSDKRSFNFFDRCVPRDRPVKILL